MIPVVVGDASWVDFFNSASGEYGLEMTLNKPKEDSGLFQYLVHGLFDALYDQCISDYLDDVKRRKNLSPSDIALKDLLGNVYTQTLYNIYDFTSFHNYIYSKECSGKINGVDFNNLYDFCNLFYSYYNLHDPDSDTFKLEIDSGSLAGQYTITQNNSDIYFRSFRRQMPAQFLKDLKSLLEPINNGHHIVRKYKSVEYSVIQSMLENHLLTWMLDSIKCNLLHPHPPYADDKSYQPALP